MDTTREISTPHAVVLVGFCAATVLLIPMERFVFGAVIWLATLLLTMKDPDPVLRRKMTVLLGTVAVLAAAPIHTGRDTTHFFTLGTPFLVVVLLPSIVLNRTDAGVIDWRFRPRQFQWMDIIYVGISIPLAWGVIQLYFFTINPELSTNWPMPTDYSEEAKWRLIIGINCVGIWDELFFMTTVYGLMRSLFPPVIAIVGQAIVYTSVLYDMAFTGIGPIVVYLFALTQGVMYEKSRCLLYVLIVHLIVDAFLVIAILQYFYPDRGIHWF